MNLQGLQEVLAIVSYGLAILILSFVADRKHRNPLAWGLIGGLLFPCSLLYLVFLPRICPRCKGECKTKTCLICDPLPESIAPYPAAQALPEPA